jgi:general nucleoside transport system permease protein
LSYSGWKIVRLPVVSALRRTLAVLGSIVVALALIAVLFALGGFSPKLLFNTVVVQQFGSRFGLEDLGLIYTPIVLCGLAAALCLRAGLWNVGADGQFYAGAIVSSGIGLFLGAPTWLEWPLMVFGAIAGGMLWILVPALARIYASVDEIISTLLLNFVAILLVTYLGSDLWRDQTAYVNTATGRIHFELPSLFGTLHIGILIAICTAVLLAILLRYSRWGYELLICGANRNTAVYAGMPVTTRLLQAMLLSGAIAGVAGLIEVTGTVHRLQIGISSSYAYLGIIAAVLVRGSMIGVLLSSALTATLLGAISILQGQGLSMSAALAATGCILLFAAIGERLADLNIVRRRIGLLGAS